MRTQGADEAGGPERRKKERKKGEKKEKNVESVVHRAQQVIS